MTKKALLLGALGLLIGCGGDAAAPEEPTVDGTWEYTISNLVGGGLSCDITGMILQIQQSNGRFAGTSDGGTLVCSAGGVAGEPIGLTEGTLTGEVMSNAVVFELLQDTDQAINEGSLDNGRITGTTTTRLDFGEPLGIVTSTGTFSAVRQ